MIFRIYPIRDTYITNAVRPGTAVRMTGSNVGFSEELAVFKQAGISGTIGSLSSSSLGRTLLQFDFTQLGQLTASGDISIANMTARLRLAHKTHGETQPSSFDMKVFPMQNPWDEGRGHDVVEYLDSGICNWVRANSAQQWNTAGGDYYTAGVTTASIHFDTGFEDVDLDITGMVNEWIINQYGNYGLMLRMSDAIESDASYVDYFTKKFYSRHTGHPDRAPYIEVRTTDYLRDDRANMQFGRTGTLYLYNLVGGQYQNLPESKLYVSVADSSGTLLSLTASHDSTGLYSASFALPTGSYSGSIFYDSWGSGSFAVFTGSFTFVPGGPAQSITQPLITARVRNLQDEYLPEDVPVFEVLFRRKGHTLPVYQTGSTYVSPYVAENAYYAIENDSTRERVVPFGTGSQQHTRLSYNENGNYFKFFMSNLQQGNVYRLIFLVNEMGRKQVLDSGFRFKVI